jgi:hypothetical protein
VSRKLAVVDFDGSNGIYYKPVDLDDPKILIQGDRGVELRANIEMLPSSCETRTTLTRGALLRVRPRYLPLPLGERVKHRAGISERASFSSPVSSWLACCLLS